MLDAKSLRCGRCVYRGDCAVMTDGACEDYVFDKRLRRRDLLAWIDEEVSVNDTVSSS